MKRILIALILALLACAPVSAQHLIGPCILTAGDAADDDPNGDVLGSVCDEYWESDTGVAWRKTSGTNTNTGWQEVRTGSGAGTGSVTSVDLTMPSLFAVSGNPVTTSGTLDVDFTSQTANRVLASPDGSAGVPSMRALVEDDLPSITTAKISDGTILLDDFDDSECVDGEGPVKASGVWTCGASGGGGGAPTGAQYLTLTTDGTLTNERVLTPGNGLSGSDAGAGAAYTLRTTCQQGEFDTSNTGATLTIDWDNGAQQIVDLDADLTSLTLSDGVNGCAYRIVFVQDGTGGHEVTWPSSVEFEDSTPPVFDTDPDNVTFCSLVKTAIGAGGYLGFCTTNPIAQP